MDKRRIIVTSILPPVYTAVRSVHLLRVLEADVWARFQKMRGHDCVHVSTDATDGRLVAARARVEVVTPEEVFARGCQQNLKDVFDFDVQFDEYLPSYSEGSREQCLSAFRALERRRLVRLVKTAPEWYCEKDRIFISGGGANGLKGRCPKCGAEGLYKGNCESCGAMFEAEQIVEATCTLCGGKPVMRDHEDLAFDLEGCRDRLKEWIAGPAVTDVELKSYFLTWADERRQASLACDAPCLGVEVPNYPGKFFCGWVTELTGLLAAMHNWCKAKGVDFDTWWQNPATEIVCFADRYFSYRLCHLWPALLLEAGYRTPTRIVVPGDCECPDGDLKWSCRSIRPHADMDFRVGCYLRRLDTQALRFYFAGRLSGGTITKLNIKDFACRVNSDLVGIITNLASRGAQLLHKLCDGKTGSMDKEGRVLWARAVSCSEKMATHYEERDFSSVIALVLEHATEANQFLNAKEPWRQFETDPDAARQVLTSALNIFRVLAIYLQPILPGYAGRVAKLFNEKTYCWEDITRCVEDAPIGPYEYLATRVEQTKVEEMLEDDRTQ